MQDHSSYNFQWQGRRPPERPLWPPDVNETPFEERNLDAVLRIARFADYFRFPGIVYFESIPDLLTSLPRTDFFEVSQLMAPRRDTS